MDEDLAELRRVATEFRTAIERSRAEGARPSLPYFPEGACRLVSRLLAIYLHARGEKAIQFVSGHFPGQEPHVRHTWLVVKGAAVDLTADPFGEAPVVVGAPTRFHESLDTLEACDAPSALAAFSEEESVRYHRLLGPIEERMPGVKG